MTSALTPRRACSHRNKSFSSKRRKMIILMIRFWLPHSDLIHRSLMLWSRKSSKSRDSWRFLWTKLYIMIKMTIKQNLQMPSKKKEKIKIMEAILHLWSAKISLLKKLLETIKCSNLPKCVMNWIQFPIRILTNEVSKPATSPGPEPSTSLQSVNGSRVNLNTADKMIKDLLSMMPPSW